jgi:hypothetical protein
MPQVEFEPTVPSVWAGEDGSCLRPRGHCDRLDRCYTSENGNFAVRVNTFPLGTLFLQITSTPEHPGRKLQHAMCHPTNLQSITGYHSTHTAMSLRSIDRPRRTTLWVTGMTALVASYILVLLQRPLAWVNQHKARRRLSRGQYYHHLCYETGKANKGEYTESTLQAEALTVHGTYEVDQFMGLLSVALVQTATRDKQCTKRALVQIIWGQPVWGRPKVHSYLFSLCLCVVNNYSKQSTVRFLVIKYVVKVQNCYFLIHNSHSVGLLLFSLYNDRIFLRLFCINSCISFHVNII